MKGQYRGYDRMAIELDHNGTGFQQTGATPTVFVEWLPRKSNDGGFRLSQCDDAGGGVQRLATPRCHPPRPSGNTHRHLCLQGCKAVACAASLAAPLLIALKALRTVITPIHRPNFVFQLCVEGMLWARAM